MILYRYISGLFVQALGIFSLTLVSLVVIIDFVVKMGRFFQIQEEPWWMFAARYYGYKLPFLLPFLLPSVILFAAMFTILRLAKSNELTPILMGGMSLRRVCGPFLVAAVLVGGAIGVLDDRVLPGFADEIAVLEDRVRGEKVTYRVLAKDVHGNHVYAESYDRGARQLRKVWITLVDAAGFRTREIEAQTGVWDEARKVWVLSHGAVERFERGQRVEVDTGTGAPRCARETFGENGCTAQIGVTPADLAKKSGFAGQFLSVGEAREAIRRYPHVALYRMQLYTKFTAPLMSVLLLLLGLPYVVSASRARNLFVGMGLCVVLVLGFYVVQIAMVELGNKAVVPAEAAAFLPVLAFGVWGAVAFARMKT